MKKKLSFILAICMLFTCLTPYSLAADTTEAALIEQFNSITTVAEMRAFLEENADSLSLDLSKYSALSDTMKMQVAAKLIGNTADSVEKIRIMFDEVVAESFATQSSQSSPSYSGGGGGFGEEITQNGDCGESVYWALGESGTLYIYGSGAMDDYATTSEIPWYSYKTQITGVEVLDGVTYIGNRAFRDTYVKTAKFAGTVTATGTSVFNSCSKLVSVDLGGNISHLNNYVLYNCDALKSIDLEGVKTVGSNTFASCGVLASVSFYKEIESIGASAFASSTKLSDLYYEGTAEEWANVTIASGNTYLTALTPRGTVEGTCGSNLSWMIRGNTLVISGTGAMTDFASTSAIPWYSYKSIIGRVSIEEGITYIGSRAFRDLEITEITIPEGVISTGSSIFNSCLKLERVNLPSTLKTLANYTFYNCDALKGIEIPYVTSIGENAFATCGALEEITVSTALKSVGASAFASSTKLTDVYYDGTETQWSKVAVGSGNAPLISAIFHYADLPENIVATGDCGDNLTWTLDTDGLLTISGTGAMNDFASTSEIPWYAFKSQIKSLIIEEGITYIGNRAFRDLSITEATIPEGVTSTGSSIFNNCIKLAKVTLPSTLKAIAGYTFYNCDALTSIELPYVTSIGANAFTSCSVLTEITLGSSLESVGASAFASSTKLSDVYYGGTEEDWASVSVASGNDPLNNATFHFAEDEEVITITQPDNLRYKYGQPIDLTGVVIESSKLGVILEVTGEYSVTGYNPLITTAQDITVTCNGLSAVITVAGFNPFLTGKQTGTISYGGVSISVEIEIVKLTGIEITSMPSKTEYTLGEELDLTGLVVEAVHSDESCEAVTDYEVSGYDASVLGEQTITVTYEDQTATLTVTVVEAGPVIIKSGSCGENVTYALDSEGLLTISGTGAMYDYKGDLESASPLKVLGAQKVVIESGITHIGNYAFYGSGFTSVEIPDSVETIGDSAFAFCYVLTSVEIPDSVTTMGKGAFSYCECLTNITIGENNSYYCSVDGILFDKNKTMLIQYPSGKNEDSYVVPDGVTTIADSAFGYGDITNIEIADSVTTIGSYAFDHSNLNSLVIPDSVTAIGEGAFYSCDSLTSVEIPDSVTTIDDYTFNDCYNLTDVYYNGTETEWNSKVTVADYNEPLLNATFHFEEEPVVLMGLEVIESGKTEYFEGEELDLTGLVVEAIYSDGSREVVNDYRVSVSGYDATVLGEQVITVAYYDSYWNYAFATYTVTVVEYPDPTPIPELAGIHIVEFPRTEFMIGEPYDDAAGIVIMAYYSDGSEIYLNPDEYIVDSSNYFSEVEGSYEIIVEYMGFAESFYVNVIMAPGPIDNTISSIMIETLPEKLTYQVGEELDLTGMVVQAIYMDGTMMDITGDVIVFGFDSQMVGTQWVSVEYNHEIYGAFSEIFEVEVVDSPTPEPTLVSIEIESNPLQTNYIVGEELNLEGLKVNAVYSDGSREEITEYSISGYDMSMSGEQTVIVSYQGFEAYFGITVDVEKATFNVEHYQETLDGTFVMYESGAYDAEVGATITAADYVKEFDGFTADLALSSDVVVSIDGTATVKIYYARNSYDVVYDFGEAGGSYTSSHKYGTNMDLAEPTVTAPEGKYFAGWADAEGNLISSLTVPAYNVTIYAQWAESEIPVTKYTVTFVDWDGTVLKTQEVAEGEAATAPEYPSREGYNFMGWDKDFSNVTSDLTVTAMYDKYILASGTCGDDINWTIYASGVLSLAGSGAMYDYTYGGEAPWYEYHSEITFVQIESGITTIGAYAFYNCENLISVATLENVTSIGEHAFDGCVSLADISVPDSTYVGEGAFKGCTSLTQIPIPGDRTEIGEGEFEGYDSMTAVVIPEGVTTIGARAFLNCVSIETVSLPSTLTTIDEDAFAGCSAIKYVYYNGTKTDFEKISISSGNDVIKENIHFFKFTVVFKDYDGNILSEQLVNVGEDAVAPTAPSKEGYTFTGWSNGYTNVTEDLVIWAQYDEIPDPEMVTYTIQYYQETAIDSESYNISTGETASDYPGTIVTISPYVPYGFELNTELSELTKTIEQDGSTIFKVYYDKVSTDEPEPVATYTVTFETQFGEFISSQTVYEGDSAVLPEAPEVPGYAFSGWDGEYENITKNTTVTALYVPIAPTVYEVTFIGFNGGVFDTKTVTAGGTVVIPAAPIVDGYEFGGWFTGENGTGTQFGYGSVVNENLTLYAYYYEAVTVVGIEVTKLPSKIQYYIGEALNTSGMIVVIKYSDGSTKEISSYSVSDLDSSTVGTKEITVTAEGYSKKFYVTVVEKPVVGTPTIKVSTVTGQVGNTIEVDISISDNPGIASMLLNLHYDSSYLTLTGITDGGILGGTVHSDDLTINPYVLTWANDTATENITANGVIATLAFEVAEDTPTGSYPISVSFDIDNYDIFDINLNTVDFATADGGILIIDHIIGDVNGDGSVNTLDRAVLSRYLSKWVGYEDINLKAADVNADGKVNTLDRAILSRYLSKWTGYETLPYTK